MVNKVAQRAIAAGLAGMMSFGAVAPAAMALDTHNWSSWWNWSDTSYDEGLTYWRRIAGDDRYGTMKKIVEASYKIDGDNWWMANVAVVASGDNFPDALAANGLAGALNNGDGAPVILTKKGSLSSQAKELLQKMSVQTVYIMGGTAAVSEATEQAIKDLKIATIRVAGADRQATSVQAFKLIDGNWYKNHGTHSVIIATGANYADALSIAPFAYRTGTPVVLTKADGTLTDEAVKAIKDNDEIYQVIVVGGTAAVSDSVFSVLGTYNGSYRDFYNKVYVPVRVAGADRYDTSAKIADWEVNYAFDIKGEYNSKTNYWMGAGFSYDETFVATGENFPDALAGGQLAGGKYYANANTIVGTVTGSRVSTGVRVVSNIKFASPILLTKDGNRAADAVIAANLAWNTNKVSVDAYNFFDDDLDGYLSAYYTLGMISPEIGAISADGFFTNNRLTDSGAMIPDAIKTKLKNGTRLTAAEATQLMALAGNVDLARQDAHWLDGLRTTGNNFHGIIFGGKAAVSKDKAKQLDDTVSDSIFKVKDQVATYSADSYVVNWNGRTYHTLAWLFDNRANWMSALGVEGFNWTTLTTTNATAFDSVIAIPYGYWQYLYQPLTSDVYDLGYDATTGKVARQVINIDLARFNSAVLSSKIANDYSGYGLDEFGILTVVSDYTYDAAGNVTATNYRAFYTVR